MTLADRTSIVVGVDGFETSVNAALWAADLASKMHVSLVLVHAVQIPMYYPSGVMVMPEPSLQELAQKAAKECLEATRQAVIDQFPQLDVSTWSRSGPADLALVGWSRRAQLVVVGAHQNISVDSVLFGSTTARLVNHSECPVAVWRGESGHGPVVVGVDGSPLSTLAVEHAFELASRYGTDLRAVHACRPGLTLDQEADTAAHAALLSENLAGWSEKYPDVSVSQILATTSPQEALTRYATNARMVVVGSHGQGRASSLLLGSTSRHVLKHSPCPVIICRAGDLHDLA